MATAATPRLIAASANRFLSGICDSPSLDVWIGTPRSRSLAAVKFVEVQSSVYTRGTRICLAAVHRRQASQRVRRRYDYICIRAVLSASVPPGPSRRKPKSRRATCFLCPARARDRALESTGAHSDRDRRQPGHASSDAQQVGSHLVVGAPGSVTPGVYACLGSG